MKDEELYKKEELNSQKINIDILPLLANLYKKKLQEEPCFSKILNESKNNILSTLDNLIIKFDTMDWRENK